jgi:hypothetical protein
MADVPIDAAGPEESPDPPKQQGWKPLEETAYRSAAAQLVHFSVKSVNSNARAGGIRLGPSDSLDLPYVSARTALAAGWPISADYAVNSGSTATAVKQIRAVERGVAEDATSQEVALIEALLGDVRASRLELGLEPVDARLRQILIPHPEAPGGYMAMTPITAGGLCEILLGKDGLVTRHNAEADASRKQGGGEGPVLQTIRRANLGIGGANPQNVGALVRSMQRPILASSPRPKAGLRFALRIYYRGIDLPLMKPLALELRASRERSSVDGVPLSTMSFRGHEVSILRRMLDLALQAGEEAMEVLTAHAGQLPHEHALPDTDPVAFEQVSRSVAPEIRGLIDPTLRQEDWPERIAERIVKAIEAATIKVSGERIPLYPMDAGGRAATKGLLKEMAR